MNDEVRETIEETGLSRRGLLVKGGLAAAGLSVLGGPAAASALGATGRETATQFKIAATRIESAGYGETRPVADNKTLEGRARNRRVELVKLP